MASISILLYYIVVILGSVSVFANLIQPEANGVFFILVTNPQFWFLIIVGPFICLLPDLTIVILQRLYFKTPADLIAQWEKWKLPIPKISISGKMQNYEISDWLKPDPKSLKQKAEDSEFDNINDQTPDDNVFFKSGKDAKSHKHDKNNDTGFISKATGIKKKYYDDTTYGNEEADENHRHLKRRELANNGKLDVINSVVEAETEKKNKKKKKKKVKHHKENDHSVTFNKGVTRKEHKSKKKHKKEKRNKEDE